MTGVWFIFVCCMVFSVQANTVPEQIVHIQATTEQAPMRLLVGIIGEENSSPTLQLFVDRLTACLTFGKTFAVTTQFMKKAPSKKSSVQKLFADEYDGALFIELNLSKGKESVEWRFYDTVEGSLVKGKRQLFGSQDVEREATIMAMTILETLLGEAPPFLSSIAYRKRDKKGKKHYLCLQELCGTREPVTLLTSQRIIIAPEWGSDGERPYLFFSEFTPSNVRLMVCDMKGRKQTVLDFDGTTVGVSYVPHSDDVVYCRSGDIWRYRFDESAGKALHSRIIHDISPCASPRLMGNGDIIYCCNGRIKRYNVLENTSSALTNDGYCVAPSYCAKTDTLVYSKRVNGVMQLFNCDGKGLKHTQLTFDTPQKLDPCWSPCGRYCAFCLESGSKASIAVIDVRTGAYYYITHEDEHCSYPAWSPMLEFSCFRL